MPILMLAIIFGLSMDYEVFLLSRIRERYDADRRQHRRGGQRPAAHRRDHHQPGPAAVIVVGAFSEQYVTNQ